MERIIDYLIHSKLFEGLTREELSFFYPYLNAHILNVSKGMNLIYIGDTVNFIGVLLIGELCVYTVNFSGNTSLVKLVAPYELFGGDIACSPQQISPYIISCTSPAEIITFPYSQIAEKSAIPDEYRCILLKNMLEIIAGSNILNFYRLEILSKRSLRARVMMYLSYQSNGRQSFAIPFDREALAEYLVADRSALSRELSSMQKDGLIRFKKNHFELINNPDTPIGT